MTTTPTDKTYSVSEFAKLAKVTVRTLHFYDEAGLLKPSQRTQSQYRRYQASDLLRLQQILTLKHLGFSLQEIEMLLASPGYDVRQSLRIQKEAIDQRIGQLQAVSYALSRTLEQLETSDTPDWSQVTAIISGLTDADKAEWLQRYYSPELREWMHERAAQVSPELIQQSARDWETLYADFRQHRHLPPDDPQVQTLAARMDRLGRLFTGGNPEIEQALGKLYHDVSQIPEFFRQNFDQDLQDYMVRALTIYRGRTNAFTGLTEADK